MALRSLYPYQQSVLSWACKRPRIALFLEMRLGKSIVATRWAEHMSPQGRKLVVAPLSTLPSWRAELALEDQPSLILKAGWSGDFHPENTPNGGRWFLTNYEAVRTTPALRDQRWAVVILDESPRIKNPKAQISKACAECFQHVPYRAILSGLPAPESLLDYFQQFKFLTGSFAGYSNYWSFRERHFCCLGYDWEPTAEGRTLIRGYVSKDAYLLNRKQAGIGSVKVRQRRYVELPRKLAKVYWHAVDNLEIGDWQTSYLIALHTKLARLVGGTLPGYQSDYKAKELLALLHDGELAGEPVVIWCRFNAEIKLIQRTLHAYAIESRAVTGATPLDLRRTRFRDFQAGRFPALVMQVRVGQYGLDLSKSSTVVYYSNSYSLTDRLQSEDRIIHPSKREPALLLDLAATGTVDQHAIDALADKRITSKSFLREVFRRVLRGKALRCQKS